jgi:predicted Rdx family selenoprotein
VADEIRKAVGVESKLIESGGGVFDVVSGGKLIFSKHKEFRFPNPGEIAGLLKGK